MSGISGTLVPENFNNFGELLRYLRERAELSQRELALYVGYHYSYMSRIENNEHIPDSAMLMARFVPALGLDQADEVGVAAERLAARAGVASANQRQVTSPIIPAPTHFIDAPIRSASSIIQIQSVYCSVEYPFPGAIGVWEQL